MENKKIIKTIAGYGSVGPPYLEWALHQVREVYKKLELNPIPDSLFAPFKYIGEFTYRPANQKIRLENSEYFFLLNELVSGKQVANKFRPKYLSNPKRRFNTWADSLSESGELIKVTIRPDLKKIKTDGRFFEFVYKDKKMTIDIGHNFLDDVMILRSKDLSRF